MNYLRSIILHLCYVLFIIFVLAFLFSCIQGDPVSMQLTIENQTDQVLNISLYYIEANEVKPGAQVIVIIPMHPPYIIRAKNTQGETVFEKSYTNEELQKIRDYEFKIIIQPISED